MENWDMIRGRVTADDARKQDFTIPVSDVRMDRIGLLTSSRAPNLQLTDWGLGQLLNKTGVPVEYGRRLKGLDTGLLADNVNFWLERMTQDMDGDKSWLVRAKGETCRAILSDQYSKLDNDFLVDCLKSAMEGMNFDVRNFDITEKAMYLRPTFPDLRAKIGNNVGDEVFGGVMIRNSEVGGSSLVIQAFVWRKVCSNGLIASVPEFTFTQRHIHLSEREMRNRVAEAVVKAIQGSDKLVEAFMESAEIPVQSPNEVLKALAKKEKYSQDFTDKVTLAYETERGGTLYHITNALTRAAQQLPMDRRLDVEAFAGDLVLNGIPRDLELIAV